MKLSYAEKIMNSLLYGDPRGFGYTEPTPKQIFMQNRRKELLEEYHRKEKDVMVDEDGREYIISDPSEGEIEDGEMTMFDNGKKIYLPIVGDKSDGIAGEHRV